MKARCYDPAFRYRSSVDTDLRATFRRVRREQEEKKRLEEAKEAAKVTDLRKKNLNK